MSPRLFPVGYVWSPAGRGSRALTDVCPPRTLSAEPGRVPRREAERTRKLGSTPAPPGAPRVNCAARPPSRRALAVALRDDMAARYQALAAAGAGEFSASAPAMADRSLKNSLLGYLMLTGEQQVLNWCVRQFVEASNMTEVEIADTTALRSH